MRYQYIAVLLFSSIFNFPLLASEIEEILPEARPIKGLRQTEVSNIYSGEDLFEIIDGGADIFIEYGFQQFIRGTYNSRKNGNYYVEVYEMTDPAAAFGIFSMTQVSEAVQIDYGEFGMQTGYFLAFVSGRYFIRISAQQSSQATTAHMKLLATATSERIPVKVSDTMLPFRELLDQKPISSLVYFRGNIGFSNLYFFHPENIFRPEEGMRVRDDEYDLFVLNYEDPKNARQNFEYSVSKLMDRYESHKAITSPLEFFYIDKRNNKIRMKLQEDSIFIIVSEKDSDISDAVLQQYTYGIQKEHEID